MMKQQNKQNGDGGVNWRKKQQQQQQQPQQSTPDSPLGRMSVGSNNNGINIVSIKTKSGSDGGLNYGNKSSSPIEKVKPRRLPIWEINFFRKCYGILKSRHPTTLLWVAVTLMVVFVLLGGESKQELHHDSGSKLSTTKTTMNLPVPPPQHHHQRLRSRPKQNKIGNAQEQQKIPKISSNNTNIQRKTHYYYAVKQPEPLPKEEDSNAYKHDFGNLKFTMRSDLASPIPISIVGDYEKYEQQRSAYLDSINTKAGKHSTDENDPCRKTPWSKKIYPTCNSVHELVHGFDTNTNTNEHDILQDYTVSYLNSGSYRDAFRFKRTHDVVDDNIVLKRLLASRDQDSKSMGKIRNEAMVMEQMSPSPRILDMYGFCGSSVQVEAMAGDFWKTIVPSDYKHIAQKTLDALPPSNRRQNNLTASEILQVSLDMAESLADLHGYEGGPITHADTHIEQWLLGLDGSIQLNDFNNAKQPLWDDSKQQYCETHGGYGGVYRSPEEFVPSAQDESRDVYSYGMNIYTMLTGLWPFYDEQFHEISRSLIQPDIIKGRRPYVDPYYRNGTTYMESKLVQVMEECWKDRSERPPIYDVVNFLREVKQNATKLGELQPSNLVKIPMNNQ